jgi:hypothetical protein
MPLNGLKRLMLLERLILSGNPIKKVDFGDLNQSSEEEVFISLSELDLNSCQIELVNPSVLALFESLKVLDLSNNKIRHLHVDIHRLLYKSATFKHLKVFQNPLECDCELLWLKSFLKEHQPRRSEITKCFQNIKLNESNKSNQTSNITTVGNKLLLVNKRKELLESWEPNVQIESNETNETTDSIYLMVHIYKAYN